MESLVNYESDDGDKKYKKRKVHSKEHNSKTDATAGSNHGLGPGSGHGRKRKGSSDDTDSSDEENSAHKPDSSRRDLSEESNQSPKRSSAKNKKNGHEKGRDKSAASSNSERDIGKADGKRRKDDRSEKKRDRHGSRDRRSRSHSRGHDDRHHKEKHKNKDKYEKRDRHEDRARSDRRDKHRRNDDRKSSYKNDRDEFDRIRDRKKEDSNNGAPNRVHSPKNQRDNHGNSGDYSWRKDSPSSNQQSEKAPIVATNQFRPHHDDKDSRTKFAMQKAEAISRSIERRANEKVQQLQKLGIEVPGITVLQTQQQPLMHQQPLMAQNTHIRFGSPQPTSTVTSHEMAGTAAVAHTDDNAGINLANFTSPVLVNPRYTEQMQKKKLIWGAKKAAAEQSDKVTTTNKWETAKFSQDNDGKMASKFLRLMGMKGAAATTPPSSSAATKSDDSSEDTCTVDPSVKKRQEMFSTMEQQYEVARQATHTMRGMGLGFGSSRPY